MRRGVRGAVASAAGLAPNAVTLAGLCLGLTAIRFAAESRWTSSIGCLALAGVCDMVDGRLARTLGAQSELGAQLDSLADLVSFGAAPAVLMYEWSLASARLGWAAALLFAGCCALRLARFNCGFRQDGAVSRYFVGLPAPGAAGLALLPLLLTLQFGEGVRLRAPMLDMALLAVLALAMVSTLPTPSVKHLSLRRVRPPILACVALVIAALAVWRPWATASAGWLLYGLSLPLAAALRRRPPPVRKSPPPPCGGGGPPAERSEKRGVEGASPRLRAG